MNRDLTYLDGVIAGEIWSSSTISDNLHALCDTIGERWCGTSSEHEAGKWIRDRMTDFGLKQVGMQGFKHTGWDPISASIEIEIVDGTELQLPCIPLLGSPDEDVRAELIDLVDGIPSHYNVECESVSGKIVLINTDCHPPFFDRNYLSLTLDEKYREAAACGAAAIVFTGSRQMGGVLPILYAWRLQDHPIPYVAISYEAGAMIRRYLQSNKEAIVAHVATEACVQPVESFNVMGCLDGTLGNEIIVNAHYDGVYGSPAAMDNASGVCVMLEVARVLAKYGLQGAKRDVRFISFAAEEKDLLGSRHFVDTAGDALDRATLVFTLDTLSAGRMKGFRMSSGTSPGAAEALNTILRLGEMPYSCHVSPMDQLDDSGDGYPFAARGIPTISLWRWRYASSRPEHQFVHTAWDSVDKINVSDLREYAYALCRFLIRLQAAPPQLEHQLRAPLLGRIRNDSVGERQLCTRKRYLQKDTKIQRALKKGANDV